MRGEEGGAKSMRGQREGMGRRCVRASEGLA